MVVRGVTYKAMDQSVPVTIANILPTEQHKHGEENKGQQQAAFITDHH